MSWMPTRGLSSDAQHPLHGWACPWVSLPLTLTQVEGPSLTLKQGQCQKQKSWDAVLGLASELPYWTQGSQFPKMGSLVPSFWCSQLCPPLPVWWILRQVFSFPGKYLELRPNLHSVSPENSFYNSALWTLLQIPRNHLKSNQLIHMILPGWRGRTVQIRPGEKSVHRVRYITCQCRQLFLLLTN